MRRRVSAGPPRPHARTDAKQAYFAWARTRLPVRRVGTPEDLAEAIVLAVTNRYITGTVITCDGGARLVAG